MKQLSALIWLSVLTAAVPFLALPLWLMKGLITALALTIAGITYYLLYQSRTAASGMPVSDPEMDDPDSSNRRESTDKNKQKRSQEKSPNPPFNPKDSNADRFASMNTYKSRSQKLGK